MTKRFMGIVIEFYEFLYFGEYDAYASKHGSMSSAFKSKLFDAGRIMKKVLSNTLIPLQPQSSYDKKCEDKKA